MLLLVLSFLEPKIRFTLQIDSDVIGGLIVRNHEYRGQFIYLQAQKETV